MLHPLRSTPILENSPKIPGKKPPRVQKRSRRHRDSSSPWSQTFPSGRADAQPYAGPHASGGPAPPNLQTPLLTGPSPAPSRVPRKALLPPTRAHHCPSPVTAADITAPRGLQWNLADRRASDTSFLSHAGGAGLGGSLGPDVCLCQGRVGPAAPQGRTAPATDTPVHSAVSQQPRGPPPRPSPVTARPQGDGAQTDP